MHCSTPGFPDFTDSRSLLAHVHWVGDAIRPSRPLSPPSPPLSSSSLSIAANTQWLKAATIYFSQSSDGWVILARLAWAQSYGGIQRVGWLGNCYSWDDKPFSALGFHF